MNDSVVYQLRSDDPEAILAATQAARNLLKVLPETPTEIVVQGGAVAGLTAETEWADKLREYLRELGCVQVIACENALNAHDVEPAALLEVISTVPAGVAHLSQRQWQGCASSSRLNRSGTGRRVGSLLRQPTHR